MAIESVDIGTCRTETYGVAAYDYYHDGKRVDFQDLLTSIAVRRAYAVEKQIAPLSTMMRNRNRQLDEYGELLAKLNKIETSFKDDDDGSSRSTFTLTTREAELLSGLWAKTVPPGAAPTKAETQEYLQLVKSAMDGLNNRAQKDMTRVQGLVERRDQGFTKSAELLKDIAESRSKLMAALGG